MDDKSQKAISSGVIVGTVIITVGVLLLLVNLGLVRGKDLFLFWPAVLIIIGVANLLRTCCVSGRLWGGFMVVAGAYLLLDQLGVMPFRFGQIWPAFLIFVGFYFLWRSIERRVSGVGSPAGDNTLATDIRTIVERRISGDIGAPVSNAGLNEFALFGGVRRTINDNQFRGGEVFAIFGGYELDLRKASPASNGAVIDANAIFGGVEITVPEDWMVDVQGVAIFGGYEDKTAQLRVDDPVLVKRLVIKGLAIFGGVEIKN